MVQISNGFGIRMFGIRAPTVSLIFCRCSGEHQPIRFFITLLFTVLGGAATENAGQSSEYFLLLSRLVSFVKPQKRGKISPLDYKILVVWVLSTFMNISWVLGVFSLPLKFLMNLRVLLRLWIIDAWNKGTSVAQINLTVKYAMWCNSCISFAQMCIVPQYWNSS